MAKTDCDCKKCRACCSYRPGLFMPGEATKAAKELGMTLKDFFAKYLTINYYADDEHTAKERKVYYLTPGWTPDRELVLDMMERLFGPPYHPVYGAEPVVGREATFEEGFTMGPCALLGPNGCKLSFKARPHECRKAYGCSQTYEESKVFRNEAVSEWRKLKGESPELKEVGHGG